MSTVKLRRAGISSAAVALAGLATLVTPSTMASAAPSAHYYAQNARHFDRTVCSSGIVFPGIYTSLLVVGSCQLTDFGTVTILGDLRVALNAYFDGITNGRLIVQGNVEVDEGGILDLGCNPVSFGPPCTTNTRDVVDGSVTATNPLEMIWHNDVVHGSYQVYGSTDNRDCSMVDAFSLPDYFTFEGGSVGGNFGYRSLHTCWLGLFRAHVRGNVVVNRNRTNTTIKGIAFDSPELATNFIKGGLYCTRNMPPPTFGDSHGKPNIALGGKFGQCKHL
jgi:hypothetical protein